MKKTDHPNPTAKKGLFSQDGIGYHDEQTQGFMFTPYNSMHERIEGYCRKGKAQLISDGTFEFVPDSPRVRTSTVLLKLRYGSLTRTRSNRIMFCLCFPPDMDPKEVGRSIFDDSFEAKRELEK